MTKKRTELTADQLRGQVRSAVFERSDDQDSSVIRFPVASADSTVVWERNPESQKRRDGYGGATKNASPSF